MASEAAPTEVNNVVPQLNAAGEAGQGSKPKQSTYMTEAMTKLNKAYAKARKSLITRAEKLAQDYPTCNVALVIHPPKSNHFASFCGGNIGNSTVICGRVTSAIKHAMFEYNKNPNILAEDLIANKGCPLTPLEETLRAGQAGGLIASKQVEALLKLSAELGMSHV